jgi:hypothetical protein
MPGVVSSVAATSICPAGFEPSPVTDPAPPVRFDHEVFAGEGGHGGGHADRDRVAELPTVG